MPVNTLISIAKGGYLIVSGLLAIVGIMMILNPYFAFGNLYVMGGWILILFGVVKLIGYCSKDLYRLAFEHDLAAGLTIITLGVFILVKSEKAMDIVSMLLGIAIMAGAYTKIQISLDSKEFGIEHWRWIMVTAIATGIVGFLMMFRTSVGYGVTIQTLGVACIVEAIQNCTTILITVKIIKQRHNQLS